MINILCMMKYRDKNYKISLDRNLEIEKYILIQHKKFRDFLFFNY